MHYKAVSMDVALVNYAFIDLVDLDTAKTPQTSHYAADQSYCDYKREIWIPLFKDSNAVPKAK